MKKNLITVSRNFKKSVINICKYSIMLAEFLKLAPANFPSYFCDNKLYPQINNCI